MATKSRYDTSGLNMVDMGQVVDDMMNSSTTSRQNFERNWYDNNFFDDGFHFRYVSRTQNKIIDLTKTNSAYAAIRALPKASRQIRGVVNLLISNDYRPIVYPERVNPTEFDRTPGVNPMTGQPIPSEYEQMKDKSTMIAKRVSHWIEEEFENQDITNKLSLMGILTAKNSVSYLHIYPDPIKEKIVTAVRDAFEVYVMGEVTELEDSPFCILTQRRTLAEIKADERFEQENRDKINPDNRHASSEIKEAYMNTRFGRGTEIERVATVIQKEAYIKEYINKNNIGRIKAQKNGAEILQTRDEGDVVIRQIFSAGNITLLDRYIDLVGYPLVDLRFEPGPLYQVPYMNRFIPQNKSLDIVASRIERYANSLPMGMVLKREGESFEVNNSADGLVAEYKSVPPTIQPLANLPPFLFNYMAFLTSTIEEQGVTLSTLGKLPQGVQAARAIEALKESEYANLVVPTRMLKGTIQRIAEKFLDLADQYFITPQDAAFLEKGEPQYFDIIGKRAMEKREELNVPVEQDVVPISGEYRVDIEIQNGLAYTREGKKAAAKELADYMLQLAEVGMIPPQAMQKFLEVLLEAFQYGPTAEFLQEIESFQQEGMLNDQQMEKIKVALAEVIQDTGLAEHNPEQNIEESKIAVAEAMQDLEK